MKTRLFILFLIASFFFSCASREKALVHEDAHKLSKDNSTESRLKGLKKTPENLLKSFQTKRRPLRSVQGESLPSKIDLSGYLPTPGYQGKQSSCTGWSTAYAYKSFHEQVERNWSLNNDSHLFSPAYIYNQINGGIDQGAYIPDALELMKTKGCATLASMPYREDNYTKQPQSVAHNEAKNFRAKSYMSVDFRNRYTMKSILAGKNCIVVGLEVYENFDTYSGGIYKSIRGRDMGGHAILVVGYDDSKKAYKLINSWGTSWGEKGYIWIDYDIFEKITFEAWVMYDDVQSTPAEIPQAPQNLMASRGVYDNQVKIDWDRISNADSYIVYRISNEKTKAEEIGKSTKDFYFDTNVVPGKLYLYAVVSVGKAGKSEYSDYVEGYARDSAKNKLPGIPQGVKVSMYDEFVFIEWDRVKAANTYTIYRWDEKKNIWEKIGFTPDTTYFDEKVNNNTHYWYSITASNQSGESESSNPVYIHVMKKTIQIPAIPFNLYVSMGEYTDQIVISWSKVPNAETYYVERWHAGMDAWEFLMETDVTSIIDVNVEPGIYYYYSVCAGNKAGYSDFSEYRYGYIMESTNPFGEWEGTDTDADTNEWWNWDEKSYFDDEGNYTGEYTDYELYMYSGKIYNSNNGNCQLSGMPLNFYVNNVFIATINPGCYINYGLPAGEYYFTVTKTDSTVPLSEGYIIHVTTDGWWFWYGCKDGSHP
ncbi:MAG: hypothetical protein JXB88_03400 [Spirochaetales bacterium]|nr:hypothetical protein [Spirochaetales bacterium]